MSRPDIKKFSGKHLDMWIGQYFSSLTDVQKYSLGEWLAEFLPQLCNTEVLEYLHPHKPHKKP